MGTLSRKAVWGAAIALSILMPAMPASASEKLSKVDKLLQEASSGSPQPVIIRIRPDARDRLKKRLPHRGSGPREHTLISAFSAELDAREIAAVANDPDVLSVSADADVTAAASTRRTSSSISTTSTTTINSTSTSGAGTWPVSVLQRSLGLQKWFSGSSVTVAVLDSGLQNGTDFGNRIVGFYDFTVGKGGTAMSPTDEYGHGTHVAGLIGSSGASSNGKYAGIAPGVKLLPLKVLDKNGAGKTSDVISALEFAVANKDRFGIRIVNLSLGHPIFESAATDPLVQAVEVAARSGLIVVAAAGNYGINPATGLPGYAGIASPGNAPSAITVGAASTAGTDVRADDRVAPFSSRGPSWYDGIAKPDVVAPGVGLVSNAALASTIVATYPSLLVTEGAATFLRLSGSSMATGVVSGLAALMIDATNSGGYERWQEQQAELRRNQRTEYTGVPILTPNAMKALLQYSATPLRDQNAVAYDALTQGSGEVNGPGSLALAYSADTTQPAGSFWMTAEWPPLTSFGGVDEAWAQNVVWGTRLAAGSSIVEINQAAWDENIVWGTMFDGDNIVWGTMFAGDAELGENIVWGTSASWDDNIVWGTGLIGVLDGDNIVWGTMLDGADNIVWGTLSDDNIVWGTFDNKVVILGTGSGGGL